jgi:hypothetical protein
MGEGRRHRTGSSRLGHGPRRCRRCGPRRTRRMVSRRATRLGRGRRRVGHRSPSRQRDPRSHVASQDRRYRQHPRPLGRDALPGRGIHACGPAGRPPRRHRHRDWCPPALAPSSDGRQAGRGGAVRGGSRDEWRRSDRLHRRRVHPRRACAAARLGGRGRRDGRRDDVESQRRWVSRDPDRLRRTSVRLRRVHEGRRCREGRARGYSNRGRRRHRLEPTVRRFRRCHGCAGHDGLPRRTLRRHRRPLPSRARGRRYPTRGAASLRAQRRRIRQRAVASARWPLDSRRWRIRRRRR